MNSHSIKFFVVLGMLVAVAGCSGSGDYNDQIIDVIDPLIEETGKAANAADQQSFDALEEKIRDTKLKLREIGPLNDDPGLINAAITLADNIDDMAQEHLTKLIGFKAQGDDYSVQAFQQSIEGFLDAEIQMFDQQQQEFAQKHGYRVGKRPLQLPF